MLNIFILWDCLQGVSNGNISGLGLVSEVKWVTTINYWIVGIPLSSYMMFGLKMSLEGLWYGPTAACFLNYVMYEYKIHSSNWQLIADKHIAKMKSEAKENGDQEEKSNAIN